MNIFKQIKNSVYGKEYYKSRVLVESLRSSIKYLLKLVAIFSLVMTIIVAAGAPFLFKFVKEGASSLIASLPEDLVLSIKDGTATINQPLPYAIKLPESLKNLDKAATTPNTNKVNFDNLIVVNTDESFNLDKFKEYSTFVLLTKSELSSVSSNGEVKVISLVKMPNTEITKPWLLEKQNTLYRMLPWFFALGIIFVYIAIFIFGFIGNILILFLYALAVWFFYKKSGTEIPYSRAYQVAIHAFTLILFVGLLGNFVKPFGNLFVKLLIFMFIIYINYDKRVEKEEIIEKTEPVVELKPEEVKS